MSRIAGHAAAISGDPRHPAWVLPLLGLLFTSPALAADPPLATCPATVTVSETLEPTPGYDAAATRSEHAFSTVTLYDGPPAERASLAPDEKAKGSRLTASWTFAPKPERPQYVVCHYAETSATLTRVLPPEVKTCSISYVWNERTGIDEHPAVPPMFVCR